MASSRNKRPRSEDNEEEEETHLKKNKLDLNNEPEPKEDDLNEEETDLNEETQVNEEANQNEEHNLDHIDKEREEQDEIVKAAFALCHFMFIRDVTRNGNQQIVKSEEEDQDDEETEHQEKSLDSVLWLNEKEKQRWINKKKHEAEKEEWIKKKRIEAKYMEEDDSDATLSLLRQWKIPATPPEKIIKRDLIEKCSKPIRKQMTKRDEEQSRLVLSKSQVTKKLLDETEIPRDGIRVSVYGPDGKVHEMKMWPDEKKKENELDLTFGWRNFVEDYELKEICDFVTVWMFRHKLSREICLAIDRTRLSFRKQVSKRISKAVFDDSD